MNMIAFDILSAWSQYAWPILLFLVGLGLVVFVHELGHFLAAKWAGVMVEKFAIGFGPKLIGFRRGETQYKIGIFPLGGYVGMLGQDDLRPGATAASDARSWQRAPAGKKLIILSAGVAMNIVFSTLLFVIVYMVGIRFVAPVVGGTKPGWPAGTVVLPQEVADAMGVAKAVGLQPGDRILTIDGKRIRRFPRVQSAAILSDTDDVFKFVMSRPLKDGSVEFEVTLKPKQINSGPMAEAFGPHHAFGIFPVVDAVIAEPGKQGYAGAEKFQKDDRIVEVAGQPLKHPWDMPQLLRANAGKTVEYVVERNGERAKVKLDPYILTGMWDKFEEEQLAILGMTPRVLVVAVTERGPAKKAGLEKADVIAAYAGVDAPSRAELLALSKKFAGQSVPIRLLRKGKILDLEITPKKDGDIAVIGIASGPEQDTPHVAKVYPDTPAANAGIAKGAVLTRVNNTPVASWPQVYAALRAAGDDEVTLAYSLDGKEKTATIGKLTKDVFDPKDYEFSTPAVMEWSVLKTEVMRGYPLRALAWGGEDTLTWMTSVFKTLRSLIKGRASHKSLAGPVGIGVIAVKTGQESVINLVYFMAMISALVAVINFLPLPVLDGGHVVLTLIEKVRGRPLPAKLLVVIQTTGLILIAGLFLALTYQDIVRWLLR